MELTIGEFPTLPSKGLDTQTTLETGHLPCDSMNQLPAITYNQPVQTTFKRLLETASDSEDNPNTPESTREQQNTVIQVCRELHRCSFRDLQNIGMGKKRRIISKAMYIELGDYDPSNYTLITVQTQEQFDFTKNILKKGQTQKRYTFKHITNFRNKTNPSVTNTLTKYETIECHKYKTK